MPEPVPVITVHDLHARLVAGENFVLLDVREEGELEISRIDPCVHVPMAEVLWRSSEFPVDADICVLCRSGRRSAAITQALLIRGFRNVRNVQGGINAYAQEIDPTLTTY